MCTRGRFEIRVWNVDLHSNQIDPYPRYVERTFEHVRAVGPTLCLTVYPMMTVPRGFEVIRMMWVPLLIVLFGGCVRENSAFFESDDRRSVDQMVVDIRDGSLLAPDIASETEMAGSDDRDLPEGDASASLDLDTLPTDPLDATTAERVDMSEDDGSIAYDFGITEDGLDGDGDGVVDERDNCPRVPNSSQSDADADGVGNRCDNCPNLSNRDQVDTDNDGRGDACFDGDGDGIADMEDNCISAPNGEQIDDDRDGIGNVCDNCPLIANASQVDDDGNLVGDDCQDLPLDSDLDDIPDDDDNCLGVPNRDQLDDDGDGVGNRCDNCPGVSNPDQLTGQNDLVGVVCEDSRDLDGDGLLDRSDNCPQTSNPLQINVDGDQWGDACDNCRFQQNDDQLDSDRDGRGDECDELAPQVVVELRWGDGNTDLDLHVVEPNGQFFGRGDCWSLERRTSWCNPGFQNDAPREQPLGILSEQVRLGSAPSGLFTVGVDRFPSGSALRATASLTFTCAQQDPVVFGPFVVGAVLSEDEPRPFFEAFHFNPETCQVFPVEGFRSIRNCPSENCEQSGFEGGVCSESVCPRTRQCNELTGQCIDLCEDVVCESEQLCDPDTGQCVTSTSSDWATGIPDCETSRDCPFTEQCVDLPFLNGGTCVKLCEESPNCISGFACCSVRRDGQSVCLPENQLTQNFCR